MQFFIVEGDHSTLTAGGHNFILTKGPRTRLANRANRFATIAGTMSLCAIFNNRKIMRRRQLQDIVHFAWPTGKVHAYDGFGASGNYRCNCFCGEVLTLIIDISKDRYRTIVND